MGQVDKEVRIRLSAVQYAEAQAGATRLGTTLAGFLHWCLTFGCQASTEQWIGRLEELEKAVERQAAIEKAMAGISRRLLAVERGLATVSKRRIAPEAVFDIPVSELGRAELGKDALSQRTISILERRLGVVYLRDLQDLLDADALVAPGIATETIKEIHNALRAYNTRGKANPEDNGIEKSSL